MAPFAKTLILLGAVILLAGLLILITDRLGINIGHLPGDIRIQTGNSTCLIGLGTSIFLSILLTLLLNLLLRMLNK